MSAILAENLTKHYGPRVGIESVDLEVPGGSVFGFLGPNGAGKTTAIRLALGLLRPTGGKISVLGLDAWKDSAEVKAHTGYVPGDLRMYPWLTLREGLRIIGQVRGRKLMMTGLALAERFELEVDTKARKMSRGMRQKLGLILAMAHEPELLVLDEPTTALDPPMQQELYGYLRDRAATGATVFFSSHTLSEVEGLCQRVAIIRDGRLVENESLDVLLERAHRRVVLRWSSEEAARKTPVPEFLSVESRDDGEWRCGLLGAVMDLVRWSGEQALDDVEIGKPDLDSLFRTYYRKPEDDA